MSNKNIKMKLLDKINSILTDNVILAIAVLAVVATQFFAGSYNV